MSEHLPTISARRMITILLRLGFVERELGATPHRRYVHPDGRRTTVSVHSSRDIGRGLLRKIPKDIEITPEEFLDLL
ncbi:MAG: type II toxin-antitoxin system HicA family toxin [Candidatus Sumerlaeota bacterium]|nr:type II toxin-antitoxin system HicA family toxin [Candidatus Sumerlaeota bacterium]